MSVGEIKNTKWFLIQVIDEALLQINQIDNDNSDMLFHFHYKINSVNIVLLFCEVSPLFFWFKLLKLSKNLKQSAV